MSTRANDAYKTAAVTGSALIGVKLTGLIAWPWVWVLAPLWISAALITGVIIAVVLVFALLAAFETKESE
jgi:hypothetical protein